MQRFILTTTAFLLSALCGGCNWFGFMLSDTVHEQDIPAELKLTGLGEKKILVFIEEAKNSDPQSCFQAVLANTITANLVKKAGINSRLIVDKNRLSEIRSERGDFNTLSPAQVATLAGAGVVLYVRIEDLRINTAGNNSLHSGSLMTRSILFNSETGKAIWPAEPQGRIVRAVVEMETLGQPALLKRLAATTSHCITRCFYNCPKAQYKTTGEQIDYN